MPEKHETTTGAITLRQTVQTTIQGQVHTFEIALTLPHNATADEMQRAIQQAHIGMQQLSEQLAGHIAGLQALPAHEWPVAGPAQENGHARPEAENHRAAPTITESAPAEQPSPSTEPDQRTEAVPETPSPARPMSRATFLKDAGTLGFKSTEIPKALGLAALADIKDYAAALEQLRQIAQAREAAEAEPAPATRGFAEEISTYETASEVDEEEPEGPVSEEAEAQIAAELASLADLDDLDEPDFGPAPEDQEDGVFAPESSSPETPNAHAVQVRSEAQRRLRELRVIRSAGTPPTNELRQAFMNCVWTPLGKDRAQELIKAIWNPPPGEKLNAARQRALMEWSKEDDAFEEVVAAMIDQAHQSAPEGH